MQIDKNFKLYCFFGVYAIIFLTSCTDTLKEVVHDKELYKQISIGSTKPYDISSATDQNLKNHLMNMRTIHDSLRNILKADSIEFHFDSNNKFNVDSIVLFKKNNYFVLYDFAERHRVFRKFISKMYADNMILIDTNLYLIKQ